MQPPAPELPPPSMDRPPGEPRPLPPAVRDGEPTARPAPLEDAALAPTTRALWVVRTALVHPDSARAVVERAHRAGFNTLLVQVRGRGDAWFRSAREPRAEALSGAHPLYDPLQVVLGAARERGLAVHAWLNVHFVAGAHQLPVDELHLVQRRPDLLAVPRSLTPRLFAMDPWSAEYRAALMAHARENGDQVEGLYTSPLLPEVTDHLEAVVRELVEDYEVDGIHLDYVRYPNREYDFGRAALESFRARLRATHPAAELRAAETEWNRGRIFAYVDAFPEAWDELRRERLTETVTRLRQAARSARPGVQVTAAVFPDPADAWGNRFQAWNEWLSQGLVEAVAVMNYTGEEAVFRRALGRARTAEGSGRIWMGLGAYTATFADAVRQACLVREEGLEGVVLFSYDWAVGPEGQAAAGGAYLDRFGREAFWPGDGTGGCPGPPAPSP